MKLGLEHTYARGLPGCSLSARPDPVPAPALLFWNGDLAASLGIEAASPHELAQAFSGNTLPDDAEPVAQAYAGHQFGHFSSQLGDGRAHLLGEVVDPKGKRWDVALKGSGRTPFSRGGDGKAAVGPMLREVLVGEFLHACGIPSTRALAVVATGETVQRETLLPGAVLTRVASSHIRVGTFQFFAARGDLERVRMLAEYAIARHDPALAGREDRYAEFLRAVAGRQAELVARWCHVGFIHGVMNTDNMAVSGESIDFGPCAFLEGFDPAAVFSSIDHGGRYAFGNQPSIAQWNLARLCETFLPLLHPDPDRSVALATEIVDAFHDQYRSRFLAEGRRKMGLDSGVAGDADLLDGWLEVLQTESVDFALAWRNLADAAEGRDGPLLALFPERGRILSWLERWRARCAADAPLPASLRAGGMRAANPRFIPRNHRVEEALAAATERGDLRPFSELLEVLRAPFADRPDRDPLAEPAPRELTARYRTFCGT